MYPRYFFLQKKKREINRLPIKASKIKQQQLDFRNKVATIIPTFNLQRWWARIGYWVGQFVGGIQPIRQFCRGDGGDQHEVPFCSLVFEPEVGIDDKGLPT